MIVTTTLAARSDAQTVSDVLTFLVTNQSVSTGDFQRDRTAAEATSQTISRAVLANLATLPVATSSSGFVYRLNPELGTVERSTQSFGPFFVERAQTAGRHQASFGLSFQQLNFTSLDGRNLRDGSLITTANQFVDEAQPFDVDRLTLNISARIATLYGSVGVTDRLEVGFAVPMVDLTLDGSRINTYRGSTFTQASASARAIGLADAIVRTKYTVFDQGGAGIAAAVDLRLPTGRREDLLGAGTTSAKFSAIGSIETGRLSTHVNAGMTVGGLARELSYGGALAYAATGRMTVSGEVLGRLVEGGGEIMSVATPHPTLAGVETIRLVPDGSNLQVVTFVPGVKWNLSDTWVLAANISVPLTRNGLTTTLTPFVGLDYAIGR
ncbi:MAG TPA: hypothetical protein VEU08_12890 [Vicinamibacterales bacterium]|nr:hypothetical protein [Vicinamibacterales bacterium]